MFHDQIRQARVDHGLSQAKLAHLAGVPRERVRQLESGGNVTIETLQKILAQLPNLRTLSLGSVELHPRGATGAEVRDALAAWLEAGRRLLTMLEQVPVTPPDTGDRRITPSVELTPELEQRLRRLETRFQAPVPPEKS